MEICFSGYCVKQRLGVLTVDPSLGISTTEVMILYHMYYISENAGDSRSFGNLVVKFRFLHRFDIKSSQVPRTFLWLFS